MSWLMGLLRHMNRSSHLCLPLSEPITRCQSSGAFTVVTKTLQNRSVLVFSLMGCLCMYSLCLPVCLLKQLYIVYQQVLYQPRWDWAKHVRTWNIKGIKLGLSNATEDQICQESWRCCCATSYYSKSRLFTFKDAIKLLIYHFVSMSKFNYMSITFKHIIKFSIYHYL